MDVDVLVAGGGPAGLGAALGAARQGAKTLLVERMGFLGGVGAIGLGMTINQMRPNEKPRSNVHEALIAQIQSFGDVAMRIEEHALITNTEYLKLAAFQALEEAGCDYLLYAFVTDAIVESGTVNGAIISTKSGPIRVNAKRVVDATGDADVVYFAGGQTAKGREGDGFLSPMTSLFVIGGVDLAKARRREPAGRPRAGRGELLEEGRRPATSCPTRMIVTPTVYPDCVFVNHSGNRDYEVLDGTSSRDLTKAERLMRQQAVDVVRLLRIERVPGFENAYLRAGQRLGRRARDPPRASASTSSPRRTPRPARASRRDRAARRLPRHRLRALRGDGPHDVPYRALLPLGVENVMASGRNISATHVAARPARAWATAWRPATRRAWRARCRFSRACRRASWTSSSSSRRWSTKAYRWGCRFGPHPAFGTASPSGRGAWEQISP